MNFVDDFLKRQANPNDIGAMIKRLGSELTEVGQTYASVRALSEIAERGGTLGYTNFGSAQIDQNGVHTDADLVDINWWLPLNLANDEVTWVLALVYDGAEWVYVGGDFTRIGGVNANNIARYSLLTRQWEALGTGVNGIVYAIERNGTDFYVGGDFTSAGGAANTNKIAKWNGSAWSALGTGVSSGNRVLTLVYSGGILYAGGDFAQMGGVANTVHIAKWNGSAWSALGTGANTSPVYALAVDTSGNLYAGGSFTSMGGVANTVRIAKWNGSAWSSIGVFNEFVRGLFFDTATGRLYAGGNFTSITGFAGCARVAYYDGTNWNSMSGGIDNSVVYTVRVEANGDIIVCGAFVDAGGNPLADKIARWNPDNGWTALSNAGGAVGNNVYTLLIQDNGSIIAGGEFNSIGAINCQSIAIFCKPLSEAVDVIASLFELYSAVFSEYQSVGWQAFAYQPGASSVSDFSLANASIASNGSVYLIPIRLDAPMLLQSVSIWNSDTASQRSWAWALYVQDTNSGQNSENNLRRVADGAGGETFTAAAQSMRTVNATGAPVRLRQGWYWLAIQNIHASNTLGIGRINAPIGFGSVFQVKPEIAIPLPVTLDAVAATWNKGGAIQGVRLNGRVFGETSAF